MQQLIVNPTNTFVAIITFLSTLLITYLAHLFSRSRKVDELLFSARRDAYTEFIKAFGAGFGPEELNLREHDSAKIVEMSYQRRQKINAIFAQARLVAGTLLEDKLRHLYELVMHDIENELPKKKEGKRERDYIGYEVEALMRYDLKAIGMTETSFWRILSIVRRRQIKKRAKKSE